MIDTICVGTRMYPGCGNRFEAISSKRKFCPECARLERKGSFVFVQRRRVVEALLQAQQEEASC
jgi:hypothetical protein